MFWFRRVPNVPQHLLQYHRRRHPYLDHPSLVPHCGGVRHCFVRFGRCVLQGQCQGVEGIHLTFSMRTHELIASLQRLGMHTIALRRPVDTNTRHRRYTSLIALFTFLRVAVGIGHHPRLWGTRTIFRRQQEPC